MAIIKGKLDLLAVNAKDSVKVNGREVLTSVNGMTSSNGRLNLTKLGQLELKTNMDSLEDTMFYYTSDRTLNLPNLISKDGVGFDIEGRGYNVNMLFADNEVLHRNNQGAWVTLASKTYVTESIADALDGGNIDLSNYYNKDQSNALFLPISSTKEATVGKLTVQGTSSTLVLKNSNGKLFEVLNNGTSLSIVGKTNNTVNNTITFPTSSGTLLTEENGNGKYLPLIGGTLTGNLTISMKGKNNSAGIKFEKDDNYNVLLETVPHSTNNKFMHIVYRDSSNKILHMLDFPKETSTIATQSWTNDLVRRTGNDTYLISGNKTHWATIINDGMFSVWHDDTKKRSFSVDVNGSAEASSFRANQILATRSEEVIKLGFNATGSPFLSYYDSDKKWTAYYFPNTNGGTVATQDWVHSTRYTKTDSDNRYVRKDLTNLGTQHTSLSTIQSGQWAKPIGYSVMVNSNSPQRPPSTSLGYWHVIGARDMDAGYAGIWTEYGGGRMFYGHNGDGAQNPSWYKIYTEASKPTANEVGAYSKTESDSKYAPSSVFSKADSSETRLWNGNMTRYLFTNNNNNSGLFDHAGGKYTWGFNANGQMISGLIPIANGGTGATTVANARTNLEVYSKSEMDTRYFSKSGGTINGGTTVSGNFTATGQVQVNSFIKANGSIRMNQQSGNWLSMRTNQCFQLDNAVGNGSASPAVRQEHSDKHWIMGGLGASQFGFYMINKTTTENKTDAQAYLTSAGTWYCGGEGSFTDVTIRSDKRKKKNIVKLDDALSKVNKLSGYTFNLIDDNGNEKLSAGIIAQELQEVLPMSVSEDDTGYLKVSNNGVIGLLVEAVKELSKEVQDLKKQLNKE